MGSEDDSDKWFDAASSQSTVPSTIDVSLLSKRTMLGIESHECTLWDIALVNAEVSAKLYKIFLKEHGQPMPEPPGWRALRRMHCIVGKRRGSKKATQELSLEQKL